MHSNVFSNGFIENNFDRYENTVMMSESKSKNGSCTGFINKLALPVFVTVLFIITKKLCLINGFLSDSSADDGLLSPSLSPWYEHPELRPLVISGPSGVGKGTLINMLFEFYNQEYESNEFGHNDDRQPLSFSVSHTTRLSRPGEMDGVHYHFTNKEQMAKGIENNKFIESAEVFGNIYGTSYSAIQDVIRKGKICVLDIDIQGAKRVKEDASIITPHFIFIAPPSLAILEKRLRDRGTETEEAIQKRTAKAKSEVNYGLARGNFDDVVINDDLDKAFLHLRLILEEWYPHLNQVISSSFEL